LAMTSAELREKYLTFFEKKGHQRISPAPLVLEGDPTTLFTSAGMQPLIPYLKGEPHPEGRRLTDSQPSLRLQDMDEVGDNRHTTFFEMLGNWSLGDYFKKEQLPWIWEFFTDELKLPQERLWVSVFQGTEEVPRDEESYRIWLELGVPKERIHFYGAGKNWWSRSGSPEKMPPGEIGGPDSEVFYDFGQPCHSGCHPNCDCGRFLEIGNSVFIQYEKAKDGSLRELPQKNVDFGGGLERLTMAVNDLSDIYRIDLFEPVIKALEEATSLVYGADEEKDRSFRIIADHLRASVMLVSQGVEPSNKLQGYVLRRLLRKTVFHLHRLDLDISGRSLAGIARSFLKVYPELKANWGKSENLLKGEADKFGRTLEEGLRKLRKAIDEKKKIDGRFAFDLYQNSGFPLELTKEVLVEKGIKLSAGEQKKFQEEFRQHQELSRTASAGLFKGGLADKSANATRLHTATHLLHAALRQVLGESVAQKGSNITAERLRFDFSYPTKLTEAEIKAVEKTVNKVIKDDLPVTFETKTLNEAVAEGALHFFAEKYGQKVKVYSVGDPQRGYFSREVCGGPHVSHTGEIGRVRIIKEEKVGAGIVRIYATNL